MPRRTNPSLNKRFRKSSAKSYYYYRNDRHNNWFVLMTGVHSTGYMEKFFRTGAAQYIEWYVEERPDKLFDIHAYVQLRRQIAKQFFIKKWNCKTTLIPTTALDKSESSFHQIPNKITLGSERLPVSLNSIVKSYNPLRNKSVPTIIDIPDVQIAPSVCWLPQPPKINPLLNRTKIIPFNKYDD